MNTFLHRLFSSLSFRIIFPVVLLMLLLGAGVYALVLRSVDHFAAERIREDIERNTREVYNICDFALQGILAAGLTENEMAVRVRKGKTLGQIEEYAREHSLQALVYTEGGRRVLLNVSSGPLTKKLISSNIPEGKVLHLESENEIYYVQHSQFELWDWHIVLLRNGKVYAGLLEEVHKSYAATGLILIIISLLMVYYLKRVIRDPIHAIITAIREDAPPTYRGIQEFEFLSENIREAAYKQLQKQQMISHQATHDWLTGLLNRQEFENRLRKAISAARIEAKTHALLYLDLDQFKIINDTCGHVAGDEVLRQVTTLMQAQLRQSDTLARLGGDEFGVLMENCPLEPATRVAESLRQAVQDFHFVWQDKMFPLGASIGVVVFGNDGRTMSDILSIADSSCYVAKDSGRNRIHIYRDDDREIAERHGEMNWIGRIQKALDENRFTVFIQKIVPLQPNSTPVNHCELLVRMVGEDGALIPPMAFIPAAERYNLMPMIDRWVVNAAFVHCANLVPEKREHFRYVINLSGMTLCDEMFLPFLRTQFSRFNVNPESICFEITETAAIANLANATRVIKEIKSMGSLFALDDFGSGMSSFAYLKNLPVDFLKIDGGFVKDMLKDPIDLAMVQAINQIGHVMGIQTIAEFVENKATIEELRKIGVDYAQGFAVHRPCPLSQFFPSGSEILSN